ncbi:MAG: PIN domain-containing protein, partial [Planctomycetota bacterium]
FATGIVVPFPVIGELIAGFFSTEHYVENVATLERFLDNPYVETAHTDTATVRVFAELWRDVRRQALNIPHNDVWIAAICIERDVPLFTFDKHFDRLPQVRRV